MARKKAEDAKILLKGGVVNKATTELMRKHALAALKEERSVQASSSWALQMKTVSWIVMQANEYTTWCSGNTTMHAQAEKDVIVLQQ